jgi:hypothetical protein
MEKASVMNEQHNLSVTFSEYSRLPGPMIALPTLLRPHE